MSAAIGTVRDYMVSPVRVVRDTESASFGYDELCRLDITAIPVVEQSGSMVGVLSHTDLLRAGRLRRMNGERRKDLSLPATKVRELMSGTIEIVSAAAPLAEAARRMVQRHVHRVYVSEDRRPTGVVSTKEMMLAVARARLSMPLSELMHRSVVTIGPADPISLAIERMQRAPHSGLVVVEDDWPIGVFSETEALATRDAPSDHPVEHWMDANLLCLPLAMPAFRAAEQALATGARRILVVDAQRMQGIVTGLDFARLIVQSEPR